MQQRTRRPGWITVLVGLALAVTGCTDQSPVAPSELNPDPPTNGGGNLTMEVVRCRADTRARTVSCEGPEASGADRIIVGGQDVYVRVTTTNVSYDGVLGQFTFDTNVRNLIPQPLGTLDGTTLDPDGVKIFFNTIGVTGGTGSITVVGDGTGTFTAAGQPYYQYNQVLDQYEVSGNKTWRLDMPATVESFAFTLFISAAVEFPNGYIDVQGNSSVRSGAFRDLTPVVRSAVGNIDPTAVMGTWTSSAPLTAEITADSGVVHGLRAGSAEMTITATRSGSLPVEGSFVMTVTPIRRTWTAAAGTTDWHTGANWLPDSIAPEPTDTAVVPAAPAGPIFPALAANASVGGLEVDVAPATVGVGAFNLTASGDVSTATGGTVTGTVGNLILSGTARTVGGVFPRVQVLGSYSLASLVTLNHRLRIQGGRLRTTGFRVRVNNP